MPTRDDLMKRQHALANFGDFALRSEHLSEVLTEACRAVANAVGTERAKVLEIQKDGTELFLRSGVGWQHDIVGKLRLPMNERSSETFSIKAGVPVVTQDIAKEDRFHVPEFMKEAGVVAFVNVPIFVPGGHAYGILQVDSLAPRDFGDDEIQFLRTHAMILGPVIDRLQLVKERKAALEQQRVLVAELQHRTRNLMGVVRSTLETTLQASPDLHAFAEAFRDRLKALARVQGLLSRVNATDRVVFDELIRSELSAMGVVHDQADKVTLDGPDGVALRSSTVQTFALALHELATNATKYGALSQPAGRLSVSWWLDAADLDCEAWLHVDWHESGVLMPPAGAAPQGTGQGRELIEHALPYQLGARTTYVMGHDGIRCSIAVPVSSRTADEETGDDPTPPS